LRSRESEPDFGPPLPIPNYEHEFYRVARGVWFVCYFKRCGPTTPNSHSRPQSLFWSKGGLFLFNARKFHSVNSPSTFLWRSVPRPPGINIDMSGRPLLGTYEQRRVLGTSDQMTPPHTHTRTLRCTARSSTGFLLDCGAPTSMMHLRTKPGVIPSFLTVLRAEPRCRRTENRFIETRRNETDSYRKWEQGGP